MKGRIEVPVWPGLHTWPWQPLHNQGDLPGCRVNSKWKKWISCLADGKLVRYRYTLLMRWDLPEGSFTSMIDIIIGYAKQVSDFTCQTQSLRFEQSGQRFEWQAGQGWRWRSWKRRGCSCQPPYWQQPDNHVLYDPASLLSLSFCSTPAELAAMAMALTFLIPPCRPLAQHIHCLATKKGSP